MNSVEHYKPDAPRPIECKELPRGDSVVPGVVVAGPGGAGPGASGGGRSVPMRGGRLGRGAITGMSQI